MNLNRILQIYASHYYDTKYKAHLDRKFCKTYATILKRLPKAEDF